MKKLPLTILFAAGLISTAARAQLVIANPSIKTTEASKSDIKDVFSGGASSLSGSHVAPVLLKSGSVTDEFLIAYVGKSDAAFRASWRSLVFSGQATMPKSLDTDAAVVDYVAHNPGAIGYIAKTAPHDGVKVITSK